MGPEMSGGSVADVHEPFREALLQDRALPGLDEHLADCYACHALADRLRTIDRWLAEDETPPPSPVLIRRVERFTSAAVARRRYQQHELERQFEPAGQKQVATQNLNAGVSDSKSQQAPPQVPVRSVSMLRQLKKERTRQLIADTALRMFAERGY